MNVTYESGRLSVNLIDLLDRLTIDEKREVADALACQDDVIDFVSQQLIDKWTEMGSHGPVCCTAEAEPRKGLDRAWRAIAKASGDIAKREIERLEAALVSMTDQRNKACSEIRELRSFRHHDDI